MSEAVTGDTGWSNPYFDAVAGKGVTVGANRMAQPIPTDIFAQRMGLVKRFAWAIPNFDAIAAIDKHGPVLEVGAGAGYWANCLRQLNVDVIATDPNPRPNDEAWSPVWKASARDVAAEYPDRTLLIIWPSYDESWATEALGMYGSSGGETCIYVGEGRGGCTADDRFHQMLHEEWTLEEVVDIPTYPAIHDRLEVWSA